MKWEGRSEYFSVTPWGEGVAFSTDFSLSVVFSDTFIRIKIGSFAGVPHFLCKNKRCGYLLSTASELVAKKASGSKAEQAPEPCSSSLSQWQEIRDAALLGLGKEFFIKENTVQSRNCDEFVQVSVKTSRLCLYFCVFWIEQSLQNNWQFSAASAGSIS